MVTGRDPYQTTTHQILLGDPGFDPSNNNRQYYDGGFFGGHSIEIFRGDPGFDPNNQNPQSYNTYSPTSYFNISGGPAPGTIAHQRFTAGFLVDTSLGIDASPGGVIGGEPTGQFGGALNFAPSPIIDAYVTINNVTRHLGESLDGVAATTASAQVNYQISADQKLRYGLNLTSDSGFSATNPIPFYLFGGSDGYYHSPGYSSIACCYYQQLNSISLSSFLDNYDFATFFNMKAGDKTLDLLGQNPEAGQNPLFLDFSMQSGIDPQLAAPSPFGPGEILGTLADGSGVVDRISIEPVDAVPEPSVWAMLIAGLGIAGAALRRRTAAQQNCASPLRVESSHGPFDRQRT